MIKKISVKNFRSLEEVSVDFDEGLNVVIGENDTGKTSLIDVLKILFDNKVVEPDDFYNETDEIFIEVEFDNQIFLKKIIKYGDTENKIKITEDKLINLKEKLESVFDSIDVNEQRDLLTYPAQLFGFQLRSNTNLDNLKTKVIEKIDDCLSNETFIFDVKNNPDYPITFLDGRAFDDVNKFFQEMFFKDKSRDMWNEKITPDETIYEWVDDNLNNFARGLTAEIESLGIMERIATYLPNFSKILIQPTFKPVNFSIDLDVKFMNADGNKILFEKMGDGTRRRVTMALLEYKGEKKDVTTYVFDEPDTHLHVKAQMELLEILRNFEDKQIILTTHSPFIMNAVKPQQIRLFSLEDSITKIKSIDDGDIEVTLNELGITNMNLFFSRKILIVEGYTEENFIPLIYDKIFNKTLRANLIKVIKAEGIDDIPRLSRVLSRFVIPDDVYILMDNDAGKKCLILIDELEIPEDNIFKIGNKEFEDSFDSQIIYNVGKELIEVEGCEVGEIWTEQAIIDLKEECLINDDMKFSEELIDLSLECLLPLKKPKFGRYLAKKCDETDLDETLINLFSKING
jgi:AAA15 family ATPase/GTPase